jgi:16S rRNA (uracil1498-N3)-methyltransferase
MAALPRFFAPAIEPPTAALALDPDESHHLVHVLRLTVGAQVEVFNGRGVTLAGVVAAISKKAVVIDHLGPVAGHREPAVAISLAVGWLRGDHMDAVVRDAAMLGVRAIAPLLTARTTARHDARNADRLVERWQRIAVGALKQCGGAWLPAISAAVPLDAWLARPVAGVGLILTEPGAGAAVGRDVDDLAAAAAGGASLLVGPEGGWTDHEVARAEAAGYRRWSLGPRVLRADAVPVAAVSALRYAWERRA